MLGVASNQRGTGAIPSGGRGAAILAAVAIVLGARADAAEQPGLLSLELPIGPRAVGMGSAYVSVADDATAMYWNPAGLARLGGGERNVEVLFQHNEWLADFRQEYVAVGTQLGRHGVGGSFSGFYIGDLDGRDSDATPTLTFGAYDVVVTGSYAYAMTERMSLGGSGKYIVSNIEDITHFAFAGDLGAQVEVAPDLRVGGAVTNLGKGLTFIQVQDELPTAVQIGGSYIVPRRFADGSLLVALDVRKTRGDDAHALIGTEFDYKNLAQVQLGYRTGFDNDGINFGAGALVSGWQLNYAVVPFDSGLGTTHRFSIAFRL
jgi:hypothetical protein